MLSELVRNMIHIGRLTVQVGDDTPFTVGAVPAETPELDIAIRLKGRGTAARLALDPEYQLGQTYMDGELEVESGTLAGFMSLIGHNLGRKPTPGALAWARDLIARISTMTNSLARARRNVEHHYDLSESFYRLFLDTDLQYSCAYFAEPGMSLQAAQVAKKAHIAAKLDLQPGAKILDIGCGWGGLAISLARLADVQVTGITLSSEQLRVARARADVEGLADRVHFELADYRMLEGRFDRIVSVGMFEHVGKDHFDDYFGAINRLLDDTGVALVHSIGRKDHGAGLDRWMNRYIFPGGYVPAASEAIAALEKTGLWLADVEILRLHYAETLRHWRQRVEANRARVEALYDERFYRMWIYYLASCEMGFRFYGLMVVQMQITRQIDELPTTRGYMAECEKRYLEILCPSEPDRSQGAHRRSPNVKITPELRD
ncbi:cyclopropane-fatty-acyl-phospholipid synthase [Sphingomonas sp. H39-1-10]|uniref:SAM-dependent methyltransferase n=1 Tax=Sphingomonas pollutisoli TaxID=3030829 RepID=UPI0023B9A21D|nr:cyclopropane-fatty-acyl-phospholipid synthase family protein [Sphingomonas pollutisoli]MDF0490540.1 cyclopropane-fatty-acyl-phospholipid synthase [Sphingomonas pollutisoli]